MSVIINNGSHLTMEGAQSLLAIYAGMNSKRSWMDKYSFMLTHTLEITAGWLQGFIDGDGSFTTWVGLSSATRSTQHTVLELFLEIKQNTHDVLVLKAIIDFLGIGTIKPNFDIYDPVAVQTMRSTAKVIVRQTGRIVEFVDENPMMTRKRLDYEDWKILYDLKLRKLHLTEDGLLQIKLIRARMNSKRV